MRNFIFSALFVSALVAQDSEPVSGLSKDVKKETQEKFKATHPIAAESELAAWIKEASGEATQLSRKVSKAVARQAKAQQASRMSLEKVNASLEDLSEKLVKLLDSVSTRGWEESVGELIQVLESKNLSLNNLAQKNEILKAFLVKLSTEEKEFWKMRQAPSSGDPITERTAEVLPSGNLAEGLRFLKTISHYVDLSQVLKGLDEEAVLLRLFTEIKAEVKKKEAK